MDLDDDTYPAGPYAQAVAFIDTTEMTIAEYLATLHGLRSEEARAYPYGTIFATTTWDDFFQHMERSDPLAAEYLSLMSCMYYKAIPRSCLLLSDSSYRAIEAIDTLLACSFVTGGESLDVHRPMHLAAQDWLRKRGSLKSKIEMISQRMIELLPSIDHKNRLTWRTYLPHMQHILQFFPDIETPVSLQLRIKVCNCLVQAGRYVESRSALQKLYDLQHHKSGANDPDTLTTMDQLASVSNELGLHDKAEELFGHVISGRRNILGLTHLDTLASMNKLALVLCEQGRLDKAELLCNDVKDLCEETQGRHHLLYLSSVKKNLALILIKKWKQEQVESHLNEAKQQIEEVIEVRKAQLESDPLLASHSDPLLVDSMNILASVLMNKRAFTRAEEILRQVIDERKNMLGPNHPHTLISESQLAKVHICRKEWHTAEQGLARTINKSIEALGLSHPMTLVAIDLMKEAIETGRENTEFNLPETSSNRSASLLLPERNLAFSFYTMEPENATVQFAGLLIRDSMLSRLHLEYITKHGAGKFLANHDILLDSFFKRARRECHSFPKTHVVDILCSEDPRADVTILVYRALPERQSGSADTMAILKLLETDRIIRLQSYLRHLSTQNPEFEATLERGIADQAKYDERYSFIEASGTDNMCLELIVASLGEGESFAEFRSEWKYLVKPPTSLKDALLEQDVYTVKHYINENFGVLIKEGYDWIKELDEVGYSRREIAELLLEEARDSPWITFVPQDIVHQPLRPDFHVPDCLHVDLSHPSRKAHRSLEFYEPLSYSDPIRLVEELCGFGGIIPLASSKENWNGATEFWEDSCRSRISYRVAPGTDAYEPAQFARRISRALTGFCRAAAIAQSAGLCCDGFTVLVNKYVQRRQDEGTIYEVVELCNIKFDLAARLLEHIDTLPVSGGISDADAQNCHNLAQDILSHLQYEQHERYTDGISDKSRELYSFGVLDLDGVFYRCALAAQFLCVGFISYIHGHAGPIDPFFLDTAQNGIELLGSGSLDRGNYPHFPIKGGLVNLTCLGEMIKKPVFTFYSSPADMALSFLREDKSFDVLTNVKDLLDTWGPGRLIQSTSDHSSIFAIGIGGGYVYQSIESGGSLYRDCHWSQQMPQLSTEGYFFHDSDTMLIGTPVTVNLDCILNEIQFWNSSQNLWSYLDTYRPRYSADERQISIQAGMYVTPMISRTSKLRPGKTLKAKYFDHQDWLYLTKGGLDATWGLQVSLCTSISRRVRLRDLLADLLPRFVNRTESAELDLWQRLEAGKVTEVLDNGDLNNWLTELDADLKDYLLTIVKRILVCLKETGVDSAEEYLVVAWPTEENLWQGLKIPCTNQTRWARIISDSDRCATFAYATTKCLETSEVKCQGGAGPWKNISKSLATAFSCTSALKDGGKHYVRTFSSLYLVRVKKSSAGNVPHLVVETSRLSRFMEKRVMEKEREKQMLHERRSYHDQAEEVIVKVVDSNR